MGHINKTYSMDVEVVEMLERYASICGPKFRMSRYVSNRVREALLDDLGIRRRETG